MATSPFISLISSIYLLIFYNGTNAITGYTRHPLDGYYCNTGLYDDVGQLDQLTCTRSCIMSATCILLMYTPITNTCLHLRGVSPCPRAIPHPDIMIMRFRPLSQEQCLIPSLLSDNRSRPHSLWSISSGCSEIQRWCRLPWNIERLWRQSILF